MIDRKPLMAVWGWRTPKDDPTPDLLQLLERAEREILICAYGFTLASVVDRLIAAHKKGVKVRLILDSSQSAGKAQAVQVKRLKDAKVPLLVGRSERGGIIHTKAFIVDRRYVWEGSWNVSASASKQVNVAFMYQSVEEATLSIKEFEAEWSRLFKR